MSDLIISGANGNMGRLVNDLVESLEEFEVVALFDPSYNSNQEKNLKKSDITNLPKADLIVDFSSSSSILLNSEYWVSNYKNIIIGSSGLTKEDRNVLEDSLNDDQLFWIVPNFSIGSILQKKWSIEASKYFRFASITERHHSKKQDTPSGTSYDLASNLTHIVSENLSENKDTVNVNDINITSIRDDKYLAEQEIVLSGNDEVLSIEHISLSRDSFTKGILIALSEYKKLSGLNVGLDAVLK